MMPIDRLLPLTRRQLIAGAGAALAAPLLPKLSLAANPAGKRLHGLSAFGELKYPADFTHFDYAAPDAPKGGRFHFSPPTWLFNQNPQTFNTLNSFILRGDAPPRMELCFDSLMVSALDEPDAMYCHLANWVEISEDRNTYRFGLRPEARFHDGSPVTAEDAAFSFTLLKEEGHPDLALPLIELVSATTEDEATLVLTFTGNQSDRAILTIAGFPILSKAYYGANAFDSSTLDVPLSSGPYRPGEFYSGRFIEYERVKDYWGAELATARGLGHFDVLRIDFYAERQAEFESFKKGDTHWREERTSKTWATEYNFPAVTDGRVIMREFPDELRPSMQAWALNQRREKFADRRTRQAIGLCFDFEWTNEKIFYGAYERSHSLFENSEFKAEGEPSPAELALLKPHRGSIPEETFGPAVMQPISDGSGRDRKNLRKASMLLQEAGWHLDDGVLKDANGMPLSLEILIRASVFERVLGDYVNNLRRLGIDASIRLVDPSQFQARIEDFNFDMMGIAYSLAATPTAESLEQFFSPKYADVPGSNNFPGAREPAFDALIGHVRAAQNRKEFTTAMRAIDRLLRARHDWIPNWHAANHRVAYWDMFGFKEPKPDYGFPVETLWWHDADRARAIGKA